MLAVEHTGHIVVRLSIALLTRRTPFLYGEVPLAEKLQAQILGLKAGVVVGSKSRRLNWWELGPAGEFAPLRAAS